MADRPRLYFLDNLRAFVIVMVVVLHASITYMLFAPEWWYVLDPDRSQVFTWLVLVVDVPNMPALFFVAGYFALPSLQRRGLDGFVRAKLVRRAIRLTALATGVDEARAQEAPVTSPTAERGYRKLFLDSVTQADEGVDLDFLVGKSGSKVGRPSH